MFSQLRQNDIDLQYLCPIRVGDVTRTSFWHDVWRDDMPLSVSFPRIYALDLHRHDSITDRVSLGLGVNTLRHNPRGGAEQEKWNKLICLMQDFQLMPVPDRLGWVIDVSNNFSISSARKFFNCFMLSNEGISTRLNNWVPIKINILI